MIRYEFTFKLFLCVWKFLSTIIHLLLKKSLIWISFHSYPLPTNNRRASKFPSKEAHRVGVMPASSRPLQSFFVASRSTSKRPSLAALENNRNYYKNIYELIYNQSFGKSTNSYFIIYCELYAYNSVIKTSITFDE